MISLNDFEDQNVTPESDLYPLATSDFLLNIERTATYPSSDINQIKITVSEEMDPSNCTLEPIHGIVGSVILYISEHDLYIEGIEELDHLFEFRLKSIRNPRLSSHNINFTITTLNTTAGFEGELVQTSNLHTLCDFPCHTCPGISPSSCDSCFPELDSVFEGMSEKSFLYHAGNSECLTVCPSGSFLVLPNYCYLCAESCKECEKSHTKPDTFLLSYQCLLECPPTYVENETDWTCRLILTFEAGSEVKIEDDHEVEKAANYRFVLKPEIGLDKESTIEINSPAVLGVANTCISSPSSTCTVTGSLITLERLLTENYLAVSGAYIEFWIVSGYTNPSFNFPYSTLLFLVQTKYSGLLRHTGSIELTERKVETIYPMFWRVEQ